MTNIGKNQNDILFFDQEYVYNNSPISRINTHTGDNKKLIELNKLKEKIQNIDNCELKSNAKAIVFGDGDVDSPIMIVGEGPGKKEDEAGKPFVGDAGLLLNKMLKAININRDMVYVTNVVNYRPPQNRKPETNEIIRYTEFLNNHISIIKPKIIILLGSTAMEALMGPKLKITKERGIWRDIVINNCSYKTIVTFHPAYLLRQPEQKKYSWIDLKNIKKEIDILDIQI